VVLQRGDYEGGETCFIQYGVGVDVREGDFLLMDVHQLHANTKLQLKTKDSIRLSIVSYLRTGIWRKTRTMTQKQAKQHMGKIANFYGKIEKKKAKKAKKANNGTRKAGKEGKALVFISDQFAESEHKVAHDLGSA
jgi:hypothetical protein